VWYIKIARTHKRSSADITTIPHRMAKRKVEPDAAHLDNRMPQVGKIPGYQFCVCRNNGAAREDDTEHTRPMVKQDRTQGTSRHERGQ
jgi:hypothetical protein